MEGKDSCVTDDIIVDIAGDMEMLMHTDGSRYVHEAAYSGSSVYHTFRLCAQRTKSNTTPETWLMLTTAFVRQKVRQICEMERLIKRVKHLTIHMPGM